MFKKLATMGLLFGMAATAPPALAMGCAPRDQIVQKLENQYSETLTAAGLQGAASRQSMLEIWSNPQSGTYTVLLTDARGTSCVVAYGSEFYAIEKPIEAEGELG
ncbi:hypothetical protein [Limimaricola pyoseonensis]|uniref:Lipoprotein n=1 Tax=Limimaricola pyoseonensis TaxID=521013 RepID=A0A1G7J4T6_9RHOB|nr:hypothetical protein [Limimaricola pyoseonensis]SDF19940.1 hypothetical protein SAMN04488567_3642 [Limimaricola pyoseonensis]